MTTLPPGTPPTPPAPTIDAWAWPDRTPHPARLHTTPAGQAVLRYPATARNLARALATSLRHAGRALAATPVATLVDILGRAGETLVRELDDPALDAIAANAALSRAMVAAAIDGMASSWTTEALTQLVAAEFPNPRLLDGFAPDQTRSLTAAGPGLALHLGAGTVPGVTVTSIMRAILVKSAVLAKPGAGDALLTVRFAQTLRRLDRRVGAAMAVQYWPGGGEEWDAWERSLFGQVDQVVVYGSDATIESVRARTPASTRLVEHPHRVGIAVVDPLSAPGTAPEAALAAALFDQRGCVSTQLVVLLGDNQAARRWCAALAGELATLESALPPGPSHVGDLSELHQLRGRLAIRAAAPTSSPSAPLQLWHEPGSRWTVILAPSHLFEPVGGRTIWVVPATDLDACIEVLAPLAPTLQTVGLAGIDSGKVDFARKIAVLGATRVVPLSQVAFPRPDWIHDGNRPLRELVRWAEIR